MDTRKDETQEGGFKRCKVMKIQKSWINKIKCDFKGHIGKVWGHFCDKSPLSVCQYTKN